MKKLILIFLSFHVITVISFSADNMQKKDSLLTIIETAKDTVLINALIQIAEENKYSDKDTALYYLQKAEELSLKLNQPNKYAKAVFLQGNILYNQNKYSQASDCYSRAYRTSENSDNKLLKAWCLERMASLNLTVNNPNLALKQYFEGLTIFEELNHEKGMAKVYNIIGIYYADKGDFKLSASYLNKSLKIHQQLKDTQNIIMNKGNMGYLYELMEDIEKAESTYIKLIPEIQKINNNYALSVINYNLSGLQQKKGDHSSAMMFLQRAINIAEQTHDTALLSSLYGSKGELYFNTNNLDSATICLEKSVYCAKSIGDLETEYNALKFLADIDSIMGDLPSELGKYKRISALKDLINEQERRQDLNAIELEYINNKNQKLIDLQQQVIESNKKGKQLNLILYIVFSIVLLLLVVIVVISRKTLLKNKKIHQQQIVLKQMEMDKSKNSEIFHKLQKEKAENELMSKNKELAYSALQLEHKQQLLKHISKSIKAIVSKDKKNPFNSELEKLENSFKLILKDQTDVDLFNKQFNQVHNDFFNNLKSTHPDLTKTELKFCAYLYIRLSSAQISSFLNVSSEAIRKTRYRIRKKISLNPGESLEDYLMKF